MFFAKREINGKSVIYLEKAIRLPDGQIKKISKIIKKKERLKHLEEKYEKFFLEKEKKLYIDFAKKFYKKDSVLTYEELEKIESMKVEYNYLIKKLITEQLKDIFDRFTANFTYESNAIEGNSLTLKDVNIVIFENLSIEGKDLREIYETKNSRDVVNLLLKNKFRINEKEIIRMHKILMKNISDQIGYKRLPNILVGKRVETTPPEKVKKEMKKLINWYKKNENLHPLIKSAIFHGRFEKIHPFADGNGRVGRFLSNLILSKSGYPPIIIRKTSRIKYLNCLEAFDFGYEDKLKRFFLDKYKKTYRKFFKIYFDYL